MVRHSLISLALISFSIVATATAIPMEVDQTAVGTIQGAVLYKEVVPVQGGESDKDVAENFAVEIDTCLNDVACINADTALDILHYDNNPLNSWFAVHDDSGALESLVILMLMIAVMGIFILRKSSSTK